MQNFCNLKTVKMIKKSIILLTLWSVTDAYISRLALTRMRSPVAFRPGVVLPRPSYPHHMMQATRRAPYILYRNSPHRYAVKHMNQGPLRNMYSSWRTTRQPLPVVTPDYEYVRAAAPVIHPDAPNLSLSEKPIVVVDTSESIGTNNASEGPKPTYEVTEKYADQPLFHVNPKIETPVGFSKASALSAAELQNIMRQNAALQLASDYGLSALHLSQPTLQLPQPTMIPQQFSMQGFHGMSNPHEFIHRGPEQIIIPPNAFYQQDPMFMHKFQTQILQYPAVDFLPYTSEIQHQVPTQPPPETQSPLYLLQNEQITEHGQHIENKNIAQRETQENSVSSIFPQGFTAKNVSENLVDIDVTTVNAQNVTEQITEIPTTLKSIETNETHRTTPIYYAQIGQSVGDVIANGFYSALNDVRASIEQNDEQDNLQDNITTTAATTTVTPQEIEMNFQNNDKKETKLEDIKKFIGSPFEKAAESVNVAYTILRANEKEPKVNKDGEVFAGQLVEAKISEDQEFNKEKATLANRPPLRLYAVTEKRVSDKEPERMVVKAKIPPKSKLIFDDKTGEPILRIYASYVDNTAQKELITAKLSNNKQTKYKEMNRKPDSNNSKGDPVKNPEKTLAGDGNNVMQFGLKMKSRSDDYIIPIYNEYEE